MTYLLYLLIISYFFTRANANTRKNITNSNKSQITVYFSVVKSIKIKIINIAKRLPISANTFNFIEKNKPKNKPASSEPNFSFSYIFEGLRWGGGGADSWGVSKSCWWMFSGGPLCLTVMSDDNRQIYISFLRLIFILILNRKPTIYFLLSKYFYFLLN